MLGSSYTWKTAETEDLNVEEAAAMQFSCVIRNYVFLFGCLICVATFKSRCTISAEYHPWSNFQLRRPPQIDSSPPSGRVIIDAKRLFILAIQQSMCHCLYENSWTVYNVPRTLATESQRNSSLFGVSHHWKTPTLFFPLKMQVNSVAS